MPIILAQDDEYFTRTTKIMMHEIIRQVTNGVPDIEYAQNEADPETR